MNEFVSENYMGYRFERRLTKPDLAVCVLAISPDSATLPHLKWSGATDVEVLHNLRRDIRHAYANSEAR